MRENRVLNAILREFGGKAELRLWRQNTGVGFYASNRVVRFGVPGQGDISGIVRGCGRRLEIECKSDTGRATPDQIAYGRMITRMGGIYILARSVEDVYAGLAAAGVEVAR